MSIGKSPGPGTGLPTQLTFKVPPGFQIGRTVYPVPHASYNKELDETSYLLEGAPRSDYSHSRTGGNRRERRSEDRSGGELAGVQDQVHPRLGEVSLSLPVVAKDAATANEELVQKGSIHVAFTDREG